MHPVFSRIERGSVPPVREWIEAFRPHLDILERMAAIPQEPQWHGEGSVQVHTDMVLQEIETMLRPGGEAAHLRDQRRLALVWGGVMHDVGKIFTTQERFIDGRARVVSPQHPSRGRSWWALHHHAFGLPEAVVDLVRALIGHHHDPHRLITAEAPPFSYRKLARHSDLELLHLLELADLRGRKAVDREEKLELLEWFRLQAVDHGVWGNPDPWGSWRDHIEEAMADESAAVRRLAWAEGVREAEAGRIFTPHEAVARSHAWRKKGRDPGELIVLCGLSGSGKSTWAAAHLPGHTVVSLDRWRERIAGKRRDHRREGEVWQAARAELKECLRAGQKVVWDATSLRRDQRAPVFQLGFEYHAWTEVVCLSTPLDEVERRQRSRLHAPPKAVRLRQIERFEWPFAGEAHALRVVPGTS